jgi:hypothetical protein
LAFCRLVSRLLALATTALPPSVLTTAALSDSDIAAFTILVFGLLFAMGAVSALNMALLLLMLEIVDMK